MQALREIFAIWPDMATMAAEIDQKVDTIYHWRRAGRIPEGHWPVVIEKAARRERLITMADLHAANRPAKQRGHPAHKNKRRKVIRSNDVRE